MGQGYIERENQRNHVANCKGRVRQARLFCVKSFHVFISDTLYMLQIQ